ncbi:hypothetical protein Golob_000988 [Gossypium lobatum]|uniref:Uncharacterized protein n=1 Tax=Gossypium lobatum TaxID=34289 RepID=A0A7J8N9Z5_9ROSI|nr:hypothetical protein [Gossypium lobatum]
MISNLFNEGAMTKLSFILIAWKLLKAFSEALPLKINGFCGVFQGNKIKLRIV